MAEYIDRDEIYKAMSQLDWQDLYLPSHFKDVIDEIPAADKGEYTEQNVRDAYNDGFSNGIQRGYEDAVRNYRETLKNVAPVVHAKMMRTEAYPHRIYCGNCYKTLIQNEEYCFEKNEFPKFCMWCGAVMIEPTQTQHVESVGQHTQDVECVKVKPRRVR